MSDKFVVDANVVISSLINKGVTHSVFLFNSLLEKFEFVAPEFLLDEVKKHKSKALRLTKMSEQEFEDSYNFLIEEISFIPSDDFIKLLPKAKQLAPHDKDAPYIALSLALNCPIFSGDKGMLSSKDVKVFSPREMLSKLLPT